MWAPLWIEQAGKGAAENRTRGNCDPERAPAELPLNELRDQTWISAGARSGLQVNRVQITAAPFPIVGHAFLSKLLIAAESLGDNNQVQQTLLNTRRPATNFPSERWTLQAGVSSGTERFGPTMHTQMSFRENSTIGTAPYQSPACRVRNPEKVGAPNESANAGKVCRLHRH